MFRNLRKLCRLLVKHTAVNLAFADREWESFSMEVVVVVVVSQSTFVTPSQFAKLDCCIVVLSPSSSTTRL